jgi:hypothetical protein
VNEILAKYDIKMELGHCCDIQMHRLSMADQAMKLSHEINLMRASALQNMKPGDQVVISEEEFEAMV